MKLSICIVVMLIALCLHEKAAQAAIAKETNPNEEALKKKGPVQKVGDEEAIPGEQGLQKLGNQKSKKVGSEAGETVGAPAKGKERRAKTAEEIEPEKEWASQLKPAGEKNKDKEQRKQADRK